MKASPSPFARCKSNQEILSNKPLSFNKAKNTSLPCVIKVLASNYEMINLQAEPQNLMLAKHISNLSKKVKFNSGCNHVLPPIPQFHSHNIEVSKNNI